MITYYLHKVFQVSYFMWKHYKKTDSRWKNHGWLGNQLITPASLYYDCYYVRWSYAWNCSVCIAPYVALILRIWTNFCGQTIIVINNKSKPYNWDYPLILGIIILIFIKFMQSNWNMSYHNTFLLLTGQHLFPFCIGLWNVYIGVYIILCFL